jgi:hypothetical protein
MTEADPVETPPPPRFTLLGDTDAAACESDVCAVPDPDRPSGQHDEPAAV